MLTPRQVIADARDKTHARVEGLTRDIAAVVEASESANLDDEHDPEGQTVGFERAQLASLLAEARTQLAALDLADARVDAGTYGVCVGCGSPIPSERLGAHPATEGCVSCASRPSAGKEAFR